MNPADLLGKLEEIMKCSVCLDKLDYNNKMLSCQHTFCEKCLDEIYRVKRKLKCPECRKKSNVPIHELPSNVIVNGYLDAFVAPGKNNTDDKKFNTKLPHGIAKRRFIAVKPGRLEFNKGDIIELTKYVYNGWYEGHCNGKYGAFDGNYVDIKVPIYSGKPEGVAKWDFDMKSLKFNKGDTVRILRKIDNSWVEGKIKGKTGIFPSELVKMNRAATFMMSLPNRKTEKLTENMPPTSVSGDSMDTSEESEDSILNWDFSDFSDFSFWNDDSDSDDYYFDDDDDLNIIYDSDDDIDFLDYQY